MSSRTRYEKLLIAGSSLPPGGLRFGCRLVGCCYSGAGKTVLAFTNVTSLSSSCCVTFFISSTPPSGTLLVSIWDNLKKGGKWTWWAWTWDHGLRVPGSPRPGSQRCLCQVRADVDLGGTEGCVTSKMPASLGGHIPAPWYLFFLNCSLIIKVQPFRRNPSPFPERSPVSRLGDLWQTPFRSGLSMPGSLRTPAVWALPCPLLSSCDTEPSIFRAS